MVVRASTNSNYDRVMAGIRLNLTRLITAQEHVSSGRRLLRPSDDPAGTARVLGYDTRIANTNRYLEAIGVGRSAVDLGASTLENASSTLTEARAKLIQGMSGTLSDDDRATLANEIELIRSALFDIGNTSVGNRALFGGSSTGGDAYESRLIGGRERAVYLGNHTEQRLRVANGVEIGITTPGSSVFSGGQSTGTAFTGLTGAASGLTADQGSGYEYLSLRHDATLPGTIGTVGLALANGGADDTILGSQSLVIDATAGTVQLGSGPVQSLPQAGAPDLANFVVENAAGGELHLDFTGFTSTSFTGTIDATGSLSIDGTNFSPLNFAANDIVMKHPQSNNVIHVDATGVTRAGTELVTFGGAINTFDVLQGIADDLRNPDGLDQPELLSRLNLWLDEVDRNQDNVIVALSSLGARSARLSDTETRLDGMRVQIEGLRSGEVDVDLSEAAIEMTRAQQQLELAQASGVRLLQTNLLNFLR